MIERRTIITTMQTLQDLRNEHCVIPWFGSLNISFEQIEILISDLDRLIAWMINGNVRCVHACQVYDDNLSLITDNPSPGERR